MKFDEAGYIMSCSTPGEDKWTETGGPSQDGGLVPGHAYTLLSAKMTRYGDKLVLIRNPWGSFEWGGDWSDNSPKWTKEAISDVGAHLVEGDGTFWVDVRLDLQMLNTRLDVKQCMRRPVPQTDPRWRRSRAGCTHTIGRRH